MWDNGKNNFNMWISLELEVRSQGLWKIGSLLRLFK
jgi:hypothetical protein